MSSTSGVGAGPTNSDADWTSTSLAADPSSSVDRAASFDLLQGTLLDEALDEYEEAPGAHTDTTPPRDQAVGSELLKAVGIDTVGEYEQALSELPETNPPPDLAEPQPPTETSMPTSDGAKVHTVIEDDWLSKIAEDNDVSLDALLAANPQFAANPDLILPGQKVSIPTGKELEVAAAGEPAQVTAPTSRETALEATGNNNRSDGDFEVSMPTASNDARIARDFFNVYDRWPEDNDNDREKLIQLAQQRIDNQKAVSAVFD
jgi:LysM repeat protein